MQKKNKRHALISMIYYYVPNLALALLVAGSWLFYSNDSYSYNYNFLLYKGWNLFPLTMWLFGLFIFYFLYLALEHRFLDKRNPNISFKKRFLLYSFLYWTFLISVETFGYHILGIQNANTSQYAGLPICDCIHAPLWMQFSYFMLGPLYFLLCELWKYFRETFIPILPQSKKVY